MADDPIQEGAAKTEADKIQIEESQKSETSKFCSEINKSLKDKYLGTNGELVQYCKENGNMRLIDPAGAIPNNSVDQEDLNIYATLVARVKNKSLVLGRQDEVKTQINFVKAKAFSVGQGVVEESVGDEREKGYGFLTTNWTDLGGIDSQQGEDLETFGMTNIDINYNSGFMPIITIDFVDIRGATLFEQGSCSPYGGFFHQPYPVFELTVKGNYGQPVKYFLACSRFTTSFDPGTGNYKSRGEFLGYSYAFLSDILLGYVMAAPYLEGSDSILNEIYTQYLEDFKNFNPPRNVGKTRFDPKNNKDGRPFTVFNYVKKIEELLGGANSDKGAIAEIQNSTELGTIDGLDNMLNVLSDIESSIDDFKEEWLELGGEEVNNVYTYGIPSGTNNPDVDQEILNLYDTYFLEAGFVGIRVVAFNELKQETGLSVTDLESSDFSITNDVSSLYKLELNSFLQSLIDKRSEITSELNKNREEFKRLANEKVKSSIGFIPTIRSFFTVLLANTELFLQLLKDASAEAEKYHEDNDNDTFETKCEDNVRVGGPDGVVWAWPTYMEKKKNGDDKGLAQVETYPGNNPKFANWPEVRFVEEFLKALQEMQKDISEELTEEDPTIDIYDGVPGRDNYFPLNSVETPAGAPDCNVGYYNLQDLDTTLKTIGERFIIASNVTSPNSNNLNTSIIASANNNAHQFRWDTITYYPYIQPPITQFQGLRYLNNGVVTPYFSAGAPFKPTKWGGLDKSITDSYTYNKNPDNFKAIGGILGYPYVDWASTTDVTRPYGIAGSDASKFSYVTPLREDVGEYSDTIGQIDSGGKIQSLINTDVSTISSSVENRTTYYKLSTDEVLKQSPCSSEGNGDTDVFVILEPIKYNKQIIYMWAGMESVISRDKQISQIPKQIKDSYFIIVAAGPEESKNQNSLAALREVFKKVYGKDEYQRYLKIAESNVNISEENLSESYLGYSLGGLALFKNDISNAKFIGLIDPSIQSGSELSNTKRWRESSRMIWGSNGMIKIFEEKNYVELQSTIIGNSGKSEKINSLNHGDAVEIWFEKYGPELLEEVATSQEELVNKIINEKAEETPTPPVEVEEKDVTIKPKTQSLFAVENGVIISKAQEVNWETIGRIEAHNFYNGVTNTQLLGKVINGFDNVSELYNSVIKSLNIPEDDIYKDDYIELYRYNQPLTLNKASRKNGGPITILPDIHEMEGSDLVRLNLLENASEKGAKISEWAIFGTWYSKVSGRHGFGIEKDSTLDRSNLIKTYFNDYYGTSYTRGRLSDGFKEGREERPRVVSFDGKPILNFQNQPNKGSINSSVYYSALGPIVESSLRNIDNSYDELGSLRKSRFSNVSLTITDKWLTVDIFPDYEFDYVGFSNIFQTARRGAVAGTSGAGSTNTIGGFASGIQSINATNAIISSSNKFSDNENGLDGRSDFNYKYARSYYEFNNPDRESLRQSQSPYGKLPFKSWHALDFASMPLVNEYSIDLLSIGAGGGAGSTRPDYAGFGNVIYNKLQRAEVLPYSTSYKTQLNRIDDYTALIKNVVWEQSTEYTIQEQTQQEINNQLIQQDQDTNLQTATAYNYAGFDQNIQTLDLVDPPADPVTPEPDPEPTVEEDAPVFNPYNDAQAEKLDSNFYYPGFAVQASSIGYSPANNTIPDILVSIGSTTIVPKRRTTRFDVLSNEDGTSTGSQYIDYEELGNANFLNVGGSLTETPFWRHNFPAQDLWDGSQNDSNTPKAYYSFFGGGVMNIADDVNYTDPGISKKPLYMGLKNDLDSYVESSKYFPGGISPNLQNDNWDYYYGDVDSDFQKLKTKLMLTNHNSGTAKMIQDNRLEQPDSYIDFVNQTNYNRTKAWKGALAYLFLANQFHRPWTGMYNSALKNLGPQGMLGLGSTTTKIPRHSVLLLGAVLWRMREANLLKSDDSKWNMEPEITGGIDPVCYPVLPEKVKINLRTYDTRNFIVESDVVGNDIPYDVQHDLNYSWPTNHGVRPPQLSIVTNINHSKDMDSSILCFPRADEWPAPNTGMVYAYDFFGDKGVTNPFKNQYKIFTPVMSHSNANTLRYENQQLYWTTSKAQIDEFIENVSDFVEGEISSTKKDYSDSAQASISTELGESAQAYLEDSIKQIKFAPLEDRLEQKGKKIAGSDEGYTRFTTIAHHISSFFDTNLFEASGKFPLGYSKVLAEQNSKQEDGRNALGSYDGRQSNPAIAAASVTSVANSASSLFNKLSAKLAPKGTTSMIVEIKTFTQLRDLINGKYTKPDGTEVIVNSIGEEIPYDEGSTTYNLSKTQEPSLFAKVQNGTGNLITTTNSGAPPTQTQPSIVPQGSNGGTSTNTKKLNLKLLSTNIQCSDTRFTNGNFTDYHPQRLEAESNGYVAQNGYRYKLGFDESRYFQSSSEYMDRSKEAQKRIKDINDLGIDTNSDNIYRYIGKWSQDGTVFYGFDGNAKIGRKFEIFVKGEPAQQASTTSSGNGPLSNINAATAEERYYQQLLQHVGYIRGYIPMGPDIWFMPTSVKNIFIEKFEEFVGDFNNFNDTSDFDEILKVIDPLNFPTPQPTSNFTGVFEDEITYPTMFAEIGDVGSDAPYMLRVTTNSDIAKYGNLVNKDGVALLPDSLQRWLNFYRFDIGIKTTTYGGGGTKIMEVREQKTLEPIGSENGTGPYVPIKEAPGYTIWSKLFDSYYIMASTTPRTWWGEFPLKVDSNGGLSETVNDYFRFNKQELWSFLKGFAEELNGPIIYQDFKDKIKNEYLDALTNEAIGGNQDDDIRLTLYKSLKSIYDKWISASDVGPADGGGRKLFYNPIGGSRTLMDHFSFVNRVNADIGDKALVNLDVLTDLFSNTRNSIFGVCSDVLDNSNFNFFPLPSYVDLSAGVSLYSRGKSESSKRNAIVDMFRPISNQADFSSIASDIGGPHFLCQYVGGNSQKLNLSVNKERGCLDDNTKSKGRKENNGDSFTLDNDSGDCYQKAPPDITQKSESSAGVVGFKVKFGSPTQSHFLGINLDQAEHKNTLESLKAIDMIANAGAEGGSTGFVAKGQNLYEIFLNRSYSCTVEALGNVMIQPLQYFELENVPMFYGSYLIRDVKHNIRPHSMKTTFTGDRIPYAVVPVVEDIISTFNIKSGQATGTKKSLGSGSGQGGPCYEDQTITETIKSGSNYIIGDSKTPWLYKSPENKRATLFDTSNLTTGGESALWASGKGTNWLKTAVSNYPESELTKEVASIIINIGANDGYNPGVDIKGLVDAIKSKFPKAKIYAIQGAYQYGTGTNKDKTLDDVKAFYKKFKDLGVELIEPPVGPGELFTRKDSNGNSIPITNGDVHQALEQYDVIMKNLTEKLPEPTGEEVTRTTTKKVEVPCGGGSSSGPKGGTPGKDVDLSTIPESTNIKKIALKLAGKRFKLKQMLTHDGKLLNTQYNSGKAFKKGSYEPLGITLHWCACWTAEGAFSTLQKRGKSGKYNLSYHIEVGEDGTPWQFADFNRTAAHGGCPSEKGPRCKSMNQVVPTMAVSYVGGVENGDTNNGYVRTWDEWQMEDFSKNGGKNTFKSKKQWDNMVSSILYLKALWPGIKFITSHHWSDGGKVDVGNNFPWEKLLKQLREGGWNKADAGADPYLITEWIGKDGKVIRDNKLTLSNADYVLEAESFAEYSNTQSGDGEESKLPSVRKKNKCKLTKIPNANKVTSEQIDAKIKEVEPSYNKAIRSAIIGNMFKESSFNTNAYTTDTAICGSYGLIQWRCDKPNQTPPCRQDALVIYCEKNSLDPNSLDGQVRFLINSELKGTEKNNAKEFLKIPNTAAGARKGAYLFAAKIERCGGCANENDDNIKNRQNFAEDVFNGTFKY